MKDDLVMTPPPARNSRKRAILGVGILAFFVLAACAAVSSYTYLQYQTQGILTRQQNIQQTILDKTLDAIRVWRIELVNQARFISSSEMFRIYITDTRDLPPERLAEIAHPEALHSHDPEIRALAEQRTYMHDLLRDFVRRQSWNDARIVTVKGAELLTREGAAPITDVQRSIAERAAREKLAVFGPIRRQDGSMYMDMADPLFEVLGAEDPKVVAILLLSVPMDKPLVKFLSDSSQQSSVRSLILDQGSENTELLRLAGKQISLKTLDGKVSDGALPFELRRAFGAPPGDDEAGQAWSLGAPPTLLNWLLVLETPANVINERIHAREWEIYGLGALATIGLAFLAAFLFAQFTSRQHKARAAHLNQLYNTISQQKLVLDGVNKSLRAGILLANDHAVILMSNPAFDRLTTSDHENLRGLSLMDVLPVNVAVDLISNMKNVIGTEQPNSIELHIPDREGNERLFRVNLLPYQSEEGEATSSGSGCVATFQDITVFRANAKKAAQRQEALLMALDRGIESVDPHLVGHAAKMARISGLLAEELGFDPSQKETLRIASLLSQVGKLFVPRDLLLKKGKLTEEEKKELAKAPEHADRILRDLHFDLPVRETVREMSERMDGSGPAGLKARDISQIGRALGVVNAFIAMTSPRSWRNDPGMSVADAINALVKDAKFDKDITGALNRLDRERLAAELGKR